jgi:hypothetical protein
MYAIEFETNITSPFIPLHNYERFLNQQVKVIVMAQDALMAIKANKVAMRPKLTNLATFNKGRKQQDFSRMDAYDDTI